MHERRTPRELAQLGIVAAAALAATFPLASFESLSVARAADRIPEKGIREIDIPAGQIVATQGNTQFVVNQRVKPPQGGVPVTQVVVWDTQAGKEMQRFDGTALVAGGEHLIIEDSRKAKYLRPLAGEGNTIQMSPLKLPGGADGLRVDCLGVNCGAQEGVAGGALFFPGDTRMVPTLWKRDGTVNTERTYDLPANCTVKGVSEKYLCLGKVQPGPHVVWSDVARVTEPGSTDFLSTHMKGISKPEVVGMSQNGTIGGNLVRSSAPSGFLWRVDQEPKFIEGVIQVVTSDGFVFGIRRVGNDSLPFRVTPEGDVQILSPETIKGLLPGKTAAPGNVFASVGSQAFVLMVEDPQGKRLNHLFEIGAESWAPLPGRSPKEMK